MLQNTTLQFISELTKNNEKVWFDANRATYQTAKSDVEQFAAKTIATFGKHDPEIAHLAAKDCLFRINRDIRFSANKTPYKTNLAFWMAQGGRKSVFGGYYVHFEPGKSFFGGGVYLPMSPELKKVRQEVAYCFDEFREIVEAPAFQTFFGGVVVEGHTLVKVPAGYEATHPAAQYLKLKSYFGSRQLTDAELTSTQLSDIILEGLILAAPLVKFLNRAIAD